MVITIPHAAAVTTTYRKPILVLSVSLKTSSFPCLKLATHKSDGTTPSSTNQWSRPYYRGIDLVDAIATQKDCVARYGYRTSVVSCVSYFMSTLEPVLVSDDSRYGCR